MSKDGYLPDNVSEFFGTFGSERPPWNSEVRKVCTRDFASSGPITRAPKVMICASLLRLARSAE